MQLAEKLQKAGVKPWSRENQFDYRIWQPAEWANAPDFAVRPRPEKPTVSCLMVSRGNLDILRYSLDCYLRQTWRERELVIVTGTARVEPVRAFLAERGVENAILVGVGDGLTLGDLRNVAIARARGEILVQWDDDDLSDPQRVEVYVNVLKQTGAAAAFLSRWLVWWPQRQIALIPYRRPWEGSIAVWRDNARVHPALARTEDTGAVRSLVRSQPVALVDAPLLYLYVVTGQNTNDSRHFENFIAHCECVFEGDEFLALNDMLAERMPVLEYAAQLRELPIKPGF